MKNKFSFEVMPIDPKESRFYFVVKNDEGKVILDSRTIVDRRRHVGRSYTSRFDTYTRAWNMRDRLERKEGYGK